MANSPKRVETLVGLFLFLGLALLGILVMQFGRFTDRFRGVYTVTVSFSDASGLIKGSQVRLAGAMVGQVVEEPALTEEGTILVEVCIREDAPRIDKNAVFQISSLSILGDKAVMISPPATPEERAGEFIEDGAFIEGAEPGGLDALQTDAGRIAADAAELLSRGKGTLTKIEGGLDDLRAVASRLTESLDRINGGVISDENLAAFSSTLRNLEGASDNIRDASVEIKPLLADAQNAIRSFDQASAAAEETFVQASSEISKLRPALQKVPETVESIAAVADEAKGTLQSVQGGDGLLGTLAYDREMKGDAKTFMKNLRHHGLLRYKDNETVDERDPRNRFRGRRR
ncbi:MAG: hypothetical protein CMP28_09725 [Roseibacillus sp.]|nr:hypothetical protein [Roseibacillus sp.]